MVMAMIVCNIWKKGLLQWFFISYFLFLSAMVYGQERKLSAKVQEVIEEGNALFRNFSYNEAIVRYKKALAYKSDLVEVQLKIAEAYVKLQDISEAEQWYADALNNTENKTYIPSYHQLNYAEVLMENGKPDEARRWYELYKINNPTDARISAKLEGLSNRSNLYKDSVLFEIAPVAINSKFSDFSPVFYEKGLVFVSAREEVSQKKQYNATNSAYLDLYYSAFEDGKLTKPKNFSKVINTKFHEGPAVFYNLSSKIIFTRNNYKSGKTYSDDNKTLQLQLFYSEKKKDGEWKEPVLLSINDKQYSVGHPAISPDGRYLYFSSDRPGGAGGTDLYVSTWRDSAWSEPESVGNIVNTEGNEMFPYLKDSILYFASNGHAGLGGLDIYRHKLGTSEVVNMGYPVNSTRDDFGLIFDPTNRIGFFSSNRHNQVNDDDIFKLIVKDPVKKEEPLPVVEMEKEIYYTVQVLALLNPITVRKSFLKNLGLKGVLKHDGKDGFHRYTYGVYATFEEADQIVKMVREKGYTDAFVRKEERYKELSTKPGVEVEKLYAVENKQ